MVVIFLAGCGSGSADESTGGSASRAGEAHKTSGKLQSLTVTLEGYPDAENVGVLMADQLGYFTKAGLDVAVLHPVDSNNVPEYVATGGDDIGLLPQPQVLMARDEGMPLVAIGRLVGAPTMAMIWPRKSRIERLADLAGKTVAINGFSFEEGFLQALFAQAGLKPGAVKVKSVAYGLVNALVKGRADAILGSANIEGAELEARGLKPVATPLQKLGVPSYEELVVVTRRGRLSGHSPWIRSFMSAVTRGTAAAIEDPKAAAVAISSARKELELPVAGPKLTETKVEASLPLLARDAQMSRGGATRLATWMHEQDLIRQKLPTAAVLTNRYVRPRP